MVQVHIAQAVETFKDVSITRWYMLCPPKRGVTIYGCLRMSARGSSVSEAIHDDLLDAQMKNYKNPEDLIGDIDLLKK